LRNGKIVFSQVAPSCANKAEARDEDDELVFGAWPYRRFAEIARY
jgi:hypothetical protein